MNPTTIDNERAHWDAALAAREAVLAADLRAAAAEVPSGRDEAGSDSVRAPARDRVDIADERLQNGLRYAEAERDMAELRDLAAARERLANGEFGCCIDCGSMIPRARLQALPAAARCVACQERHEKDHPVQVRLAPDL
jgi:DnaK suppressor protein